MKKTLLAVLCILIYSVVCAPQSMRHMPVLEQNDLTKSDYLSVFTIDGRCSAFVISKNYAITAAHCMQNISSVGTATFYNKNGSLQLKQIIYASQFDRIDFGIDMGALIGDFSNIVPLPLIKTEQEINGLAVVSIGIIGGEIKRKIGRIERNDFFGLKANMKIIPGMSGGPLIDILTGKVIGINSRGAETGSVFSTVESIYTYLRIPVQND